ncbi:MAG: diacylglycerol kinase family lipid kinase [Acidobacteria bacterium]|nr:diacylglycerol kinase family lipid kinase [Acidobacteriota bacterium]
MNERFFAVVNPAAGGGRCGKLAPAALQALRQQGLRLEIAETQFAGEGKKLARQAYSQGFRHFLAVGGDGTSYEIVNGLFPAAARGEPPTLAFLPLGTGNSFLRDFTRNGAQDTAEALLARRHRPCDVLRLAHSEGTIYFLNLLSMGFTADVAALTNRRFKALGELGYLLGVLICLLRLNRRAFPLRVEWGGEMDRRRCLFLTFNNSKYTGGKMMIAPQADPADGWIEFVRWGPIGRLGLLRNLHRLYDGSHVNHPLAARQAVRRVDFDLDAPVDVMVDGEVLTLRCQTLDILPGALNVMV